MRAFASRETILSAANAIDVTQIRGSKVASDLFAGVRMPRRQSGCGAGLKPIWRRRRTVSTVAA